MPVNWAALARGVLHALLPVVGNFAAGIVRKRWYKRQFRKAVETVSREFSRVHPEVAGALANSPDEIAQELASFLIKGTLPQPKALAQALADKASIGSVTALTLAQEYLDRVQSVLFSHGVWTLFSQASGVTTAQAVQRIEQQMTDTRLREVELELFAAGDRYVDAAQALRSGDDFGAAELERRARSHLSRARNCHDADTFRHSQDTEQRFVNVRAAYEEVRAEFDATGQALALLVVELERVLDEFKDAVNQSPHR